jgi:hypothetical protein
VFACEHDDQGDTEGPEVGPEAVVVEVLEAVGGHVGDILEEGSVRTDVAGEI